MCSLLNFSSVFLNLANECPSWFWIVCRIVGYGLLMLHAITSVTCQSFYWVLGKYGVALNAWDFPSDGMYQDVDLPNLSYILD